MLSQLSIENFALIEKLELQLSAGLNVLTGETGAGKSIIIDAVSLLLGGRGSQEFIRTGADRASVEGIFLLEKDMPAVQRLEELGYELEEGALFLGRELSVNGRNTCRVQGRVVPLNLYREIGLLLIDIHGQHDYQSLLRPENHLQLLDSLGEAIAPLRDKVASSAQAVQETKKKLTRITGDERDTARREDMLKFQLQEIEAAKLRAGEEEELLLERQRLANAEKLATLAQGAYQKLFAGFDRQQSAFDLVGTVLANLRELVQIDSGASTLLEGLEGAYYQMEEISHEVRDYLENITFDPDRQESIEERVAMLKALKRKYGNSIEEVLQFYSQAAAELEELKGQADLVADLEQKLTREIDSYNRDAEVLSGARKKLAEETEAAVMQELADLNMPGTRFHIDFKKQDKINRAGQDLVEFTFSSNQGEPLRPLAKTASGGELSRVVLALKTILAKTDPVPTLIFDEVDSGVGGKAVRKVAEKLARIGKSRQVLCVTHSPQIASFAARHFFITKQTVDNRTITTVEQLAEGERKLEIARMLAGEKVTKVSLDHAEEMLKMAKI